MNRPNESIVHGSKATPKDLPSIDRLLQRAAVRAWVAEHGHTLVAAQARGLIDGLRERALSRHAVVGRSGRRRARSDNCTLACSSGWRRACARVLNLTGTVIHTNLGRALLADAALQHLMATMAGAEQPGVRPRHRRPRRPRQRWSRSCSCTLTGAEAATVVNNNAAAVLLTIAALARGREVIVSRGELVEIGGAFRMPDVMARAGAHAGRGGHHQPHAPARLRARHRRSAPRC